MADLREGILERCAAVAHGLAADLLRAVDVTEGDIIEIVEHADRHIVRAADRKLLGLAGHRARDELVRDQHIAARRVHVRRAEHRRHRVRIAFDVLIREETPHLHRLEERQQINIHRAVLVRQRQRRQRAVVDRRDMDAGRIHQPSSERQALCRVMVSADEAGLHAARGKLHQKIIEQRHRFRRRDGFIVNVACDEHRIRRLAVDNTQDFA